MKVHIALVGGQAAPVYHGIVATQPDKVVYVYSKDSERVLTQLRAEVVLQEDKLEPLHTTDPKSILQCAQDLAQKYSTDEVTVNISSGLKSWSHFFCIVFDKMPNATVVYMDQNNVLWNYRTMQPKMGFDFDMNTLFRLYGNPLKHYTDFADYTEDDHRVAEAIESVRFYNSKQFTDLLSVLKKDWDNQLVQQHSGRFVHPQGGYVEWTKDDFVRLVIMHNKKGVKKLELVSPHAVSLAFNTGWFEYKVARMLSHWKYAKDIRLNCIFPPSKNQNMTRYPKNEVDIIVNTGTKLLFVECKTKLASSTNIDKFRTVVKNYGGSGSKALFITDAVMNDTEKEKCTESQILHFSLSDQSLGPNKEQALFALLNRELFNINA